LIFTPNGNGSVVFPDGVASWTPAQWKLAQVVFISVTLAAALLISWGLGRRFRERSQWRAQLGTRTNND
jgi:hypothetical protein